MDGSHIDEIIEAVTEIARGNYSVQLGLSGENDEFDILAKGINAVIVKLEEKEESLKQTEKELEASADNYFWQSEELKARNEEFEVYANLLQKQQIELEKSALEILESNKHLQTEITNRKRTEEALQKAHNKLEQRVKERTAELVKANKQLKWEIEERKQAEEALQKGEEKLRIILETIPDPIVMYDTQGHPQYLNPAFTQSFGWSLNELQGKRIPFVPDDQKEITGEKIKELYDFGKPVRVESKRLTKEGQVLDVNIIAALIESSDGKPLGLVAILTDITKTKRLEEQLQQTQKLESIGILAGGLAHDFNNLLAIIVGNIDLAKDDIKPEHGISVLLDEAEKACFLAQNLTKQLITFSKGGAPFKELSYISNLIEKATNFALSGSTVGCQFNMPADLWPAEIDQGQIRHVINNVVINAVQAMPKGGTIEVCAENFMIGSDKDHEELSLQDGKYIKLSIQDQGIGISDKDLFMIFNPYYSSKERGTQKGMGLGLATSYSIIKKHNGEITAETKAGVGTTINIYLPASEIEVPVKKKLKEKAISGKGRILVMDDEEMVRNMTGQMLNRLGYKVEFSKDGNEAVEYYRESMKSEKPFDTVILDLTVRGGMGGREAIQKLIEIDPDVQGIVSSGHSEDPVMNDFGKFGFCSAIAKPYSMAELSFVLDKVITDTDVL